MNVFTIIGWWADTGQRFATHIKAATATEAEAICAGRHEGVIVCGVIRGRHECAD